MSLRQKLFPFDPVLSFTEWERSLTEQLEAHPEASAYTDEEVCEFLGAAHCLDSQSAQSLVRLLRHARIAFPPALTFSPYHLGRHVLSRWRDPDVRDAMLRDVMLWDPRVMFRLRHRGTEEELVQLLERYSPPVGLWLLRTYGMTDRIPSVRQALSPEQTARLRALIMSGRLLMHRLLGAPAPMRKAPRALQHKLARRIRQREARLHTMRRSLDRLGMERREWLARLRRPADRIRHELGILKSQLDQIQRECKDAALRHESARAEQQRRYLEEIRRMRSQVEAVEADCLETLSLCGLVLRGR